MRWMPVFALVFFALLPACTGEQVYHCDLRTAMESEDRCQERSVDSLVGATSSVQYKELCASDVLDGEAGDGPCPRDNAVAACLFDAAGLETVTDVYYAPTTLEEATRECEGDGELIDP